MSADRFRFRRWDEQTKTMPMLNSVYVGGVTPAAQYYCGCLMQSTGMLDMNGREIFEGDIVSFNGFATGDEVKSEVFWDESEAGFCVRQSREDERGPWTEVFHASLALGNRMTVIGNKYQNPELLK